MRIVVITGLSGSGKSTAVRALEDEGFFCIDNLPVQLFPTFADLLENSREKIRDVALVMDIRGRDFLKGYEKIFQELGEAGHTIEIVFFEASDQVLIRRFSETRRRHPALESGSVPEGIGFEREQLGGLQRMATHVIDTSDLNVHQLRARIISLLGGGTGARKLVVLVQSFGYRYGLPLESDLVIDVRFLPNPYFVPELKEFSGLDPRVRGHVVASEDYSAFMRQFKELLAFLLPRYQKEGKSYLTVSVGCTGGRHRSVVIAEELREYFKLLEMEPKVIHRDIEKG